MKNTKRIVFAVLSVIVLAFIISRSPTSVKPVVGTGTGDGFGGKDAISVTITLKDGVITHVSAQGPKETQGIGSVAVAKLPEAMVKGNTIKVDGVIGVTLDASAILSREELEKGILDDPAVMEKLAGRSIVKTIVVPDRLVNIVAKG